MGNAASSFHVRLLIILYLFSGTSSLAYEVLWARMLSIQFGVSIFGVVVAVSAFMLGLGLGSVAGARIIRNGKQMLFIFAGIEAGIAAISLLLPIVFENMELVLVGLAAQWSVMAWHQLQFVMVFILLFLPALLMGFGFPLMLNVLRHSRASLSKIYGLNALGAAFGALLPLLLLPTLGWLGAMQSVAAISVVVAIGIVLIAMNTSANSNTLVISSAAEPRLKILNYKASLLAYAGIGAAAIILEIGWTRLFGMILLRTEYVLAIILAVYLLGIGLGSLLAVKLRQTYWFALLPIIASLFSILTLWCVPILTGLVNMNQYDSLLGVMMWQGGVIALLTLPVTLVLGAWLPLLTKKMGNTAGLGAYLYGVNSVGAAIGGLAAGFLLIPGIGTNGTIIFAALSLCVLGFTWANKKIAWLAVPLLLIFAYPVASMSTVAQLKPEIYANSLDLYRYEDAINITHVVERADGQRILLSDLQRMDASSDPTAIEVQKNQARLPLLFHENPRSVLFLGLGTGISAAGSLSFPQLNRTAVEISQGAINAAEQWFAPVNMDIMNQLNVVRDDARRYLMSTENRYDVIVGDLFHPDMVGRSALLSTQQFQRAKSSLSENGLFVQWLAINQFDIQSFEIVLRSFNKVFPNSVIFIDAFRLALVGPKNQFNGVSAIKNNMQRMSAKGQKQALGGEGVWTWLGRYWGHLDVGVGVTQDEWAPQIEYKLPVARYNGELDLVKLLNYLLQNRVSVKNAMLELAIEQAGKEEFERAFIGTDLAHRSWLALLTKQTQKGQRDLQFAYKANPKDRWIGFAIADGVMASLPPHNNAPNTKIILESVLKVRPDHPEALRRLWQIAQQAGDIQVADSLRKRLLAISPFEKKLVSR